MKKLLFIFLLGLLTPFLFVVIYIKQNSKPVSSDTKVKMFVINQGDGIETIGDRLEKNSLVRDKFTFIVYAYYLGLNKKIQYGTYRLSPSMTVEDLIVKLSKGGVRDYWLKIKDGSRVEEIASVFSSNITFSSKDFLLKAKNKEGYLFPDSYLIPEYYTVDQVLDMVDKNFSEKFDKAKIDYTNDSVTDKQAVILASLLEREGKSLESKQKIAGILLNRIQTGMPLQLDATVQYARDSKNSGTETYWTPISKDDLSINSPYNTYINKGLPPKPICNPGYNSLYAVFHPTKSDYLFYITGNDGKMYYAKTLEEHNKNIQKYLK
jgi:UPF0755 protein